MPETNIFTDVQAGLISPRFRGSFRPTKTRTIPGEGCGCDDGPSWVASIVNAIGQSDYWNSSRIVVLWDDWGGFYDHVAPDETARLRRPGIPRFRCCSSRHTRRLARDAKAVTSPPRPIVRQPAALRRGQLEARPRLGTSDSTANSISDISTTPNSSAGSRRFRRSTRSSTSSIRAPRPKTATPSRARPIRCRSARLTEAGARNTRVRTMMGSA